MFVQIRGHMGANLRRTRVKVCCIATVTEAQLAVDVGADAVGLVGPMPSGPGVIGVALAGRIAAGVPPPVATVLLSSETSATAIIEQVMSCGTSAIQLVTHVDPAVHAALRMKLPALRRIQVIHVEGTDALDLIDVYAPFVHAFLLDSGRPSAAVPEFGGTGRAHDWEISRRFVERSGRPVFLAGGLNPTNVGEAIEIVGPYGLDVCSGVRTADALDEAKISAFLDAVSAADRRMGCSQRP